MEKVFSVEEAQTKLYAALADAMDFKYLKSKRCLKKTEKKAKEIYSDIPKEEVQTYQKIAAETNSMLQKGDMRCLRTEGLKNWMINRCNRKYVMDNKLY